MQFPTRGVQKAACACLVIAALSWVTAVAFAARAAPYAAANAATSVAAREASPRDPLAVTLGAVEAPVWVRPEGAPSHGAEDNAAAVAAVLEAARLLRDVPTDRSIIFACWSAEQEGLWGSRHFVGDPVASGVYFVRVRVGQKTLQRKVVFLR